MEDHLECRNPVRNADGTINCEVNHPVFGWIPFTASPVDVEAHGRDIYAQLHASGQVGPYAPGDAP